MPYCAKCGNELAEIDVFCNLCGSKVVGNKPRSEKTDGNNRQSTIVFYVVIAAMILWWFYSGMPTNRFWWR